MPRALYLAGPEVFLPDAIEVGLRKKALCAEFGFIGLYPLDNEIVEGENRDARIYAANLALIEQADAAIFNLSPFRGIGADAGTAFELGVFVAQAKPVFAYSGDPVDFCGRASAAFGAHHTPEGGLCDAHGFEIENFGNADNLMLDCALKSQGRSVLRAETKLPLGDLTLFTACLRQAVIHFGL
ncbi:nucleoside 2-deoxyribosyltransferase [Rhodoblastus acidophilus]|uniref:nucleoside 2-deoxyribosyltransferase n=1 Tax=Rhodoblastus acidophilus TaxID=1074 RepID=UPI0022249037|nr:nucleoside 2-deoxyribosyltransferase [Rhodoblastus acidophilus]MCW2286377.1 nucleoside 2-deoxyribosyltransferase [Rhodoblastus acidophilus]MCW2333463.1 nucleoside 2-deoxyribosyltransferase [Rhodoblastus acidophilus]